MPSEERMTVDERRKYLRLVAPRYAKAAWSKRSALLTEMEAVTGLHRKSLLRLRSSGGFSRPCPPYLPPVCGRIHTLISKVACRGNIFG